MPNRSEKWSAGWVHTDKGGVRTYIIRRKVGGRLYEVSTRATSPRAAFKQLEKFEADPVAYAEEQARAAKAPEGVYLDDDLVALHLAWCRDAPEKKNSKGWLGKQRGYLKWWSKKLRGVDLRKATLQHHIIPALDDAKARAHRIAVIKGLYSWLRRVRHTITPAEDPVFGTLAVPQADPSLRRIKNKSFPKKSYEKARAKIDKEWRPVMDLQAGTGWHVMEVKRFAQGGIVEPLPPGMKKRGVAGVVVCPQTKRGNELRTAVSARVLAAAKLVLKRKTLSVEKYGLAVKAACLSAGVEEFTPGRFRHAVATWSVNAGADLAQVSTFLNHKSPKTTRTFYANFAVPAKVPTLL